MHSNFILKGPGKLVVFDDKHPSFRIIYANKICKLLMTTYFSNDNVLSHKIGVAIDAWLLAVCPIGDYDGSCDWDNRPYKCNDISYTFHCYLRSHPLIRHIGGLYIKTGTRVSRRYIIYHAKIIFIMNILYLSGMIVESIYRMYKTSHIQGDCFLIDNVQTHMNAF